MPSVRDAAVTTAGYQGPPAPNQWFGGPALANAGTIVLRDAAGLVVDSLNYGGLVDPWAAEGYQAESGAGRGGCSVPSPVLGGGRLRRAGWSGTGAPTGARAVSRTARTPTATAAISSCRPPPFWRPNPPPAATNIKVASVRTLAAGQTIIIDAGDDRETVDIATVGTAGATTLRTDTDLGATVIPVASAVGFGAGQPITIGNGADLETAVVASVSRGDSAAAEAALAVPPLLSLLHSRGRTRREHRSPAAASRLPRH